MTEYEKTYGMITHRIASGGRPSEAAIAGNAMFIIESSEITKAPAAAIHRVTWTNRDLRRRTATGPNSRQVSRAR
jgi:hypothetical protein